MDLDPYRDWLKIRDEQRPLSHYLLLGLRGPAVGRDEIESAYAERMQLVRRYQVGAHMEVAQRLVSELSAAYVCLSDPGQKQAYDATLRGQQTLVVPPSEMRTQETAPPAALPSPAPVAAPLRPQPLAPIAKGPVPAAALMSTPPRRARRSRRGPPPVVIAGAVTGCLALALGWFALNSASSVPGPAPQPHPPKPPKSELPVAPLVTTPPKAIEDDPPAKEGVVPVSPPPGPAPAVAPANPIPPTNAPNAPPPAVVAAPPALPQQPPIAVAKVSPRVLPPPRSITPRGLARPISDVAWSPDSTRLILAAQPAVLIDAATGTHVRSLGTAECPRASFSGDGQYIALHLYQTPPIVSVEEADTGKQVFSVETFKADGWLFGFSPKGATLAVLHPKGNQNLASFGENLLTLVNFSASKPKAQTLDEFKYPACIAWNREGDSLAWAMRGASRGVRVTRLPSRAPPKLLASDDFEDLAWAPKRRILAGFSKAGVTVVDLAAPKKPPLLQLAGVTGTTQFSFSHDGNLAAAIVDAEILAFDLDDPKTPRWRQPGTSKWQAVAWSPALPRLAALDSVGTIRVWDEMGQLVVSATSQLSAATRGGMAFSPDGQNLAAFGQNYNFYLFDTSKL